MLPHEEEAFRKIEELGRLRAPAEAVGVMVRGSVIELPNHSPHPQDHFQVYTDELLDLLAIRGMQMTPTDWEEMVIWHTHPSGLIGPSRIDMRNKVAQLRRHLVVALHEDGTATPSFY